MQAAQKHAIETREFAFSARDLVRVSALIHARAGIALNPRKENMVYGRLSRRLRACGMSSFGEYLDMLEADPVAAEWEAFTNALTTNLTAFFREGHHFPILREHLLAIRKRSDIIVWCAAASTGEEAYSIAITACEAFGTLTPPVHVVASDIDTGVIATGDRGMYAMDRMRGMPHTMLRRYFLKGRGANSGFVRVKPELRALVKFCRINLRDGAWNMAGRIDAIFCRNVLIYFDRPTQLAVLSRFAPLLADGGLLFAGHSESLAYASHLFRPLGNTVYAKGGTPGQMDAPT
ncbi:MAG: chemotaxis protein CheR [Pseudomonadota bacterium]|nr:chemotaxis protein CheR [Pseudomonadota bacterium]